MCVTSGSDIFVGRVTELAELAAILRDRRGGVVLVAGQAGIGKSRLVAEALRVSASPAVRGSCWQGDGAPAFWPWTEVIRGCVGFEAGAAWRDGTGTAVDEVIALLPEGRPASTADASRFRLFDGVTRLVQAVAAQEGLAVVFDDLQWVDEGSARLLGFAVRALQDQPVVFVGTYRDDEIGADHPVSLLLAELAGRVRHVALTGLDSDGLSLLADAQLGPHDTLATDLVPNLYRLTGGNPFFAREVLALIRGRGGALGHLQVPAGVRAVIERRLARLSNGCDDALKVAAVIGTAFSLDDLAAAMGRLVADVFGLLGEAVDAQIAVIDNGTPGGLRFAHDLLRETIYESITPANRVAVHARVADALEGRPGGGPPSATLAHHLLRAVPLVERARAVDAAMRAGNDAVAVLANEEAGEWFERALSLSRADTLNETGAIGALLALGDARLRASELPRARDAFVEAANIARRHGRPDDLALAALGLGAGLGGFEITLFDHVQIELLEEALRAVDPADSPARARLLARLSVALSFVAEERRLDLSTEAVAMARRLGDQAALGYALAAHCDAISGPAHSEARRGAAAEVVAIGLGLGDRRLELLGRRLLIAALLELGEMAGADAQIGMFSASADALREPLYRWYVPLWRGMRALMSGRVEECAALCAEAEALGAMADSVNATMLTLTQRWVRLRAEGRLTEAAELVDEKALEVFGELAGTYAVSALSRLQLGDVDGARSRLRDLAAGLDRVPLDAEWIPTMAQLAELAVALGDRPAAAVLDAAMAPFDDRVVVEGVGAAVCGTLGAYRAPLALLLGRAEEGRELAAAAAAAAQRIGLIGGPQLTDPSVVVDATPVAPDQDRVGVATREADTWVLTFAGATRRVRDSKGLRDLAVLLADPGKAVHVTELMSQDASGRAAVSSRGDEVLDRRAIAEFRRRLAHLDDELAEAKGHHDEGRVAKFATERQFLLDELAGATGLGGRSRRMGDDVDRARKAVRARVRDAIARVESAHPELGRHLARAVQTGTFCSYDPEVPVRWTVRG